ncbi:MAG: glycosyltransferase family 39 protein [Caldilineaceae bacterium]|nr:glycosyltransferase family 39 protein [Caldilineaceae bacterium]
MHVSARLSPRTEQILLALIVLAGLVVRLLALGAKGLAYDEAATALMARATPAEIVYFHWDAAFEHPPLWQLTMYLWSALFGQSEAMLRLLPALAGTAAIPLTWLWVKRLWPHGPTMALLAAFLVSTSPILVLYSQEARMYTLVVVLALLSLLALRPLVQRPGMANAVTFALINWLMTGYHYYSLLLVAVEGLFLLLVWLRERTLAARLAWWLGACVLSVVPISLWMLLAPGFRETYAIITGGIGQGSAPTAWRFLDGLWRDLAFGGIRWQPDYAVWSYLLLLPAALGLGVLLWRDRAQRVPWSWLVALIVLTPLAVSALLFRSLAARYILFIVPSLYLLAGAGIAFLGRRHFLLGVAGAALALAVAVPGLGYYFGPYHKSEYREMARFLQEHRQPEEAVMLYAPRQHLLAKYYLPASWSYATAPALDLPPYWPVTAPLVVPEEMDGQIQALLQAAPALWLVVTAENEVDPGEFVPKYLTAVAYKEECWRWLDVYLCRFVSPHFVPSATNTVPDVLFNDDLRLQRAAVSPVVDKDIGYGFVLVELLWQAEQKPSLDYRVTLRLTDADGRIVAQRDELPIGTLLPPTTWNAGDVKPGYMALPLPGNLAPGVYHVMAGLYDAGTGALFGDLLQLSTIAL